MGRLNTWLPLLILAQALMLITVAAQLPQWLTLGCSPASTKLLEKLSRRKDPRTCRLGEGTWMRQPLLARCAFGNREIERRSLPG